MVNILNMKDDIVKVLFWLNVLLFIGCFFISSKGYMFTIVIINIIFNGTFLIIKKYFGMFDPTNNIFGMLNGVLESTSKWGSDDGKVQG